MALIGEQFAIDVAFLPIGDNFTMGPKDAAAAAHLLKAKSCTSSLQHIPTDQTRSRRFYRLAA